MRKKSQYDRYGFIYESHMPKEGYTSATIPYTSGNWAVMKKFSDVARNHCGAVAATNLVLQLADLGVPSLKINNRIKDTFVELHNLIGNGPVMTIASNLDKYISSRGHTLSHSRILTYSGLQKAISNNKPCALLLCASPLHWHWVVAVGWRQYSTGEKFIRIVTGWDNSSDYFCRYHGGSIITSIAQYWISK